MPIIHEPSGFVKYRIRVYNPQTKKTKTIGTFYSLLKVKSALAVAVKGNVNPIVESSGQRRIYVQGVRPSGQTKHITLNI